MIRDITIGQYYPAQSPIHKLDPRVKLFATLIYIIALFSYKGIAGVLFIVAALAAVIKISKVPFKFMVKGLKSIIILLLFTACFSVFFTQGEYTIWEYGILHISDTGLINAYGCHGFKALFKVLHAFGIVTVLGAPILIASVYRRSPFFKVPLFHAVFHKEDHLIAVMLISCRCIFYGLWKYKSFFL